MVNFKIKWEEAKINTVQLFNTDYRFNVGESLIDNRKIASFTWDEGGIVALDENNKPLCFINDEAISHVYYE